METVGHLLFFALPFICVKQWCLLTTSLIWFEISCLIIVSFLSHIQCHVFCPNPN